MQYQKLSDLFVLHYIQLLFLGLFRNEKLIYVASIIVYNNVFSGPQSLNGWVTPYIIYSWARPCFVHEGRERPNKKFSLINRSHFIPHNKQTSCGFKHPSQILSSVANIKTASECAQRYQKESHVYFSCSRFGCSVSGDYLNSLHFSITIRQKKHARRFRVRLESGDYLNSLETPGILRCEIRNFAKIGSVSVWSEEGGINIKRCRSCLKILPSSVLIMIWCFMAYEKFSHQCTPVHRNQA